MTEVTQRISRVLIKAPIQDVWNALTKEGEVLPFFFGSVMHTTGLKPGAQLRMRTPNGKFTGSSERSWNAIRRTGSRTRFGSPISTTRRAL